MRDAFELEKMYVDQIQYESQAETMTVAELFDKDFKRTYLIPDLLPNPSVVLIYGAGGDGKSMAAAFALGAEGVQMGTRMVSAKESPVHENWKQAIINAKETDTVFLNRFSRPALRALRTEKTTLLEHEDHVGLENFANMTDLYFGGDMESSIALTGQVAGRITSVKPVAQIIDETMTGFWEAIKRFPTQ